tara:strand:- start:167 stop:457 length:291 start_codon:yes stop_codon:yes gene_type:complete
MKEENKKLRIGILITGIIFYLLFFTGFVISPKGSFYYFDSYYVSILEKILFFFSDYFIHPILVYSIVFSFQLIYFFCLWKYRENIAILIRKFIKNI